MINILKKQGVVLNVLMKKTDRDTEFKLEIQPLEEVHFEKEVKYRYLGLYFAILVVITYNIALTLSKIIMIGNPSITSLEIVLTRYLCTFLFNLPFIWKSGENPLKIKRKTLKKLLTIFSLVLVIWLLMYYSLKYLPVGLIIVIHNS